MPVRWVNKAVQMKVPQNVKVLHVISGLEVGGAQRLLLWAARYHDRDRYPMGVISLLSGGEFAEGIRQSGVPVLELGQRRGRLTASGFKRLMAEVGRVRPLILQGHMFHGNLLVRTARPLVSRESTVINMIHNTWHPVHRRVIDGSTAWLASAFITFSTRAEDVFTRPGPFGRPVRYIPYGIEIPPRYGGDIPSLRTRLGLPRGSFVWVAVGSLTRQKAFHDLIPAFARVVKSGQNARLIIAGEGEERPRLEKLISDLGMGDLISLLGGRLDVPELLAASDAFVLSSHWEGNPLVLLEAMAACLPAVVTRVGMVPTMAVNGETAIIVDPKRPEALAEAMLRLMELGEKSRSMGEAGRARLELYYDFHRMQREVEMFYDELTADGKRNHWR